MNTIGDVKCNPATTTVNDASNFATAIPNFKTTNGAIYYNFGTDPFFTEGVYPDDYDSPGTPHDDIYTVYIDIDGPKQKSLYDQDVIKFTVTRDGKVLPDKSSQEANNTNYLSANVRCKGANGAYTWPERGVTFKRAACKSGFTTEHSYCPTIPPLGDCEMIINKPGF